MENVLKVEFDCAVDLKNNNNGEFVIDPNGRTIEEFENEYGNWDGDKKSKTSQWLMEIMS